jgi:hypothetical protein
MNNKYNEDPYLDEQASANIITALIRATKIITTIAQQKGCRACSMLQNLQSILDTLSLTKNENQQIAKQSIERIIELFAEQIDCNNEVCKKVWMLLQELFKNPSNAEDIISKLKQILTDLHMRIEREE